MNNIYLLIATRLAQFAFTWLMGALAAHLSPSVYTLVIDIITDAGGETSVVLWVAGTLVAAGFAVWARINARAHFLGALNTTPGATIKTAKANAPSVLEVLKNPNPAK